MNMPKDKIEELYQQHFQDFEKLPDDNLWQAIETSLPVNNTPIRSVSRWALVVGILFFLSGFYWIYKANFSKKTISHSPTNNKQKKDAIWNKKQDLLIHNSVEYVSKQEKIILKNNEKKTVNILENKTRNQAKNIAKNTIIIANNKFKKQLTPVAKHTQILYTKSTLKSTNFIFENNENLEKNNHTKKENLIQTTPIKLSYNVKNIENDSQNITEPSILTIENKIIEDKKSIIDTNTQVEILTENELQKNKLFAQKKPLDFINAHSFKSQNILIDFSKIAFQSPIFIKERQRISFTLPNEIYISINPTLNYYRIFATKQLLNFDGSNNGNRLGLALQTGAVYQLKNKHLQYRIGLGYSRTKTSFNYEIIEGKTVKYLANNSVEFSPINISSVEVTQQNNLSMQHDLIYKIQSEKALILGLNVETDFRNKTNFYTYLAYKMSKAIGKNRQLWIEPSYVYSLNKNQSKNNNFYFNSDKYGVRFGFSYLLK